MNRYLVTSRSLGASVDSLSTTHNVQDGLTTNPNLPARIDKLSIHTHGANSGNDNNTVHDQDLTTRKNNRKSYKSSGKNPDRMEADITNNKDTVADIYAREISVQEIRDTHDEREYRHSALNRPVDRQSHFPVNLVDDLNGPGVYETISNYSLSPRPLPHGGHTRHSTSPLPLSHTEPMFQRSHKKGKRTLSLDTKPLAELKTRANIPDINSKNQIPLNVKLQPIPTMNVDNSLISRLDSPPSDDLLFRRHSFDNRLHTHKTEDTEEETVTTATSELRAVPRFPARLRPLSGGNESKGKIAHLSLPHI